MHAGLLAIVFVLMMIFTPGTASATDIFTPVLNASSDSGVASMECTVLNTALSTVSNVTISIHLAGNGATTETTTGSIAGFGSRSVVETSVPGSGPFYCRVSGISPSRAKVSFCLRDANDSCTVVVTTP